MNTKNLIEKIDADELVKNLRFNNNEYLTLYLKEIWTVNLYFNYFRIYP